MTHSLEQLRERLAELSDLRDTAHVLEWDRQTMMPPRGSSSRAEALATLERISHDLFVSSEMGRQLDDAERELGGAAFESDEASLLRVARRRWEKARRVPTELAAEIARASSIGQDAWVAARASSDFDVFTPHLVRNVELARRYVECSDGFECAYDVLLDDFEPRMKTTEVSRLFNELKSALVPMIATLAEHSDRVDDSCLHGTFPVDRQRQLALEVVQLMGFERSGWRLDDAVHPFATAFGSQDVRITTRWDESYFASSLYGAMHECGHGLYEAGIAQTLQRTPLGAGESLGIHESQSRLWENMIGRSRAFSGVLAPRIAALFGGSIAGLDPPTLYRAINRVKPSFIRVEADEATYGLHIVLRFELEQDLIEGRVSVAELPDAWNAKVKDYLGLDVPNAANGVLQDVHWAAGMLGYFPTYALGNLIAGSLWEKVHGDVPDLDEQVAAGELSGLREWLREHVHRHGAKFSAVELLEREFGERITVAPFVSHLRHKLCDVYGLDL
jgi:carboxypeptidase Taq